jgi:hypothetical protein
MVIPWEYQVYLPVGKRLQPDSPARIIDFKVQSGPAASHVGDTPLLA